MGELSHMTSYLLHVVDISINKYTKDKCMKRYLNANVYCLCIINYQLYHYLQEPSLYFTYYSSYCTDQTSFINDLTIISLRNKIFYKLSKFQKVINHQNHNDYFFIIAMYFYSSIIQEFLSLIFLSATRRIQCLAKELSIETNPRGVFLEYVVPNIAQQAH